MLTLLLAAAWALKAPGGIHSSVFRFCRRRLDCANWVRKDGANQPAYRRKFDVFVEDLSGILG